MLPIGGLCGKMILSLGKGAEVTQVSGFNLLYAAVLTVLL